MGKVTGFLETSRQDPERRDAKKRLGDSLEIYQPMSEADVRDQAGRCMDCGVPFCQQGCPLGNMIPDWNDLVYRGRWKEAYDRLTATHPLPELTGRLCPAPCEPACVLSVNQPAVTIEQVEKEIIERAFREGWVVARPPEHRTGRSVAVVGSGPAGLAAAHALNQAGHQVTVYERDARLGGLCRYGIPDFKLEKDVLDRRLQILEAEGIQFVTGAMVGVGPTWAALRKDHDAVLSCIGAQAPRDVDIPGRALQGVCFALDYLGHQNRLVSGERKTADPALFAKDKRVVILGGGDTGSDCLGTALRQGARTVTQLQLWDPPPQERERENPWPQWPVVFRTSSSQEEGGNREFAIRTEEFVGQGGRLNAIRTVRVKEDWSSGVKTPAPVPDSDALIPADLAVLAIGYRGAQSDAIQRELGVELDARGNVRVGENYESSVSGVYAAGDSMRGASLIVWAVMDGLEAARHIDSALRHGASVLPTRGHDLHFGGLSYRRQGSENR